MKEKKKFSKKVANPVAFNLFTLFEVLWANCCAGDRLSEETKQKFMDFKNSLYEEAGFPEMLEITDNEVYIIGYEEQDEKE